jgi:hypothetical protein
MASPYFRYLLAKNRMVFDKTLAKVDILLEVGNQASEKICLMILSQEATIKRAKELLERCDSLLGKVQAMKKEVPKQRNSN